jgi:stress response protein SCP2
MHVGLDPIIMMESKNWNGKTAKKFNLVKDESLNLPTAINHLTLGLGWDTKLDLDASIIMLDKNGELIDQVFFNQLKSKDSSIVHSGDNRDGVGHGDDERI